MIAILLDSNIYDRLAEDLAICEQLKALIHSENVRIIVSRTVAEELTRSHFRGVPSFFPVEYVGNTVGNVNMAVNDSIGSGEVFTEHLGLSKKTADAYIADAASWYADWLVTEDGRLLRRAQSATSRAEPMNYATFTARLRQLNLPPNH